MSDTQRVSHAGEKLPAAKVRRRKWNLSVVWIVPVVAAMVAGYLVYRRAQEYGAGITIRFKEVSGLKIGQTPIKYRGVSVGEVTGVELDRNHQYVLVRARLQRSAASIAREGSKFWIVRPEVGIANITGLATIISGPHIEAWPGGGEFQSEFVGLEASPAALEQKGLRIVLLSRRLESLKRARRRSGRRAGSSAQHQRHDSGHSGIHQAALCESGSEWLEVLECKRRGCESRLVPWRGNQCGIAAVARGRRNRFRDPERSEGRSGKGWDGFPSLRQAGKGMVGMDARDTDSAGEIAGADHAVIGSGRERCLKRSGRFGVQIASQV